MPRYHVTLTFTFDDVEAASEDEAEEKAYDKLINGDVGGPAESDVEEVS